LLNIPERSTYDPSQHTAPPNITTSLWNSFLLNPEKWGQKVPPECG
jgi:hypothetical protein